MITCTKCGSEEWANTHLSAINPAEDTFKCKLCYHVFKRYDQPEFVSINIPNDITSANIGELVFIAKHLYRNLLGSYDEKSGVATTANLQIMQGLNCIQQAAYFFQLAEISQMREK